MSIGSIADKQACSNASGANTGKLGCLSLFGTPAHLLAIRKGTEIPSTEDFNLAYITPLVQKGIMIPIIDAAAFEDLSSEDSYSTNSSGEKRMNLEGLPEYKFMYEEGHEFYKQLARLKSYKAYDFAIGDDAGNWMFAKTSAGNFKGFTAGHFTPELTKRKVMGGDSESKSAVVQFLDRLQFDKNYSILHSEDLTMTPQEMPQVNGVVLEFTTAPTGGDTTLKLTAKLASDRESPVEGLLVANFKVMVEGTTEVPTLLTETGAGIYILTVDALVSTETVSVDLWDGTLSVHVTESNDVLYRSDALSAVIL